MIDIALCQDSQRRIAEIQEDIKKATKRKNFKDARQLTKELEEEQKTLAMIMRVDINSEAIAC